MEQSEVARRVIGILTQASDWNRRMREDVDRTDVTEEATDGAVGALMNELLPTFTFASDAPAEEVAQAMASALGQVVVQLVGVFSFAFVQLAEIHDAGRTDITSEDMLRDIALRAESIFNADD